MEKDYIFLKEYGARLIEKGKCFPDVGICNGKLGIAICLFHLNLILKDDLYKKAAFALKGDTSHMSILYKAIPKEYNTVIVKYFSANIGLYTRKKACQTTDLSYFYPCMLTQRN